MYCTKLGSYWRTFGCTPRKSGSRVVRITPGQWHPTLVQYGQPLASGTPPSCSSRPEQAPAGSGPLIEHHREPDERYQEPEEGPEEGAGVSRSVTKAQTALIQAEQNRMIPRFSFTRPESWRFFVADLDTIGLIPSKESGAAEPRGHRDQGAAVFWDEAGQRDTWVQGPTCSSPRTNRSKTPAYRRPGGWGRNVRVARDSPGSDPPAPR